MLRASAMRIAKAPNAPHVARLKGGESRVRLPPCRITNTAEEMYKNVGVDPYAEDYDNYVEFENLQSIDPTRPMEQVVFKPYVDQLFPEGFDQRETDFWFNPPPEGWDVSKTRYKKAKEVEPDFIDLYHPGEGRIPIDSLKSGEVFTGVITDCWLYHGIEVDIGAEYDVLVALSEDDWELCAQDLFPGDEVKVQLHTVRYDTKLWRFPTIGKLLEPSDVAANILMQPEDVPAAVFLDYALNEQGWSVEEFCKNTGRTYQPTKYFVPKDPNMESDRLQAMMGEGAELDVEYTLPYNQSWTTHRVPGMGEIEQELFINDMVCHAIAAEGLY